MIRMIMKKRKRKREAGKGTNVYSYYDVSENRRQEALPHHV